MKKPDVYDYAPNIELKDLPDTFLWKTLLQDSVVEQVPQSRDFDLPTYRTVLFSGAPGNGKHSLCEALMASLYRKEIQSKASDQVDAAIVCFDGSHFDAITGEEQAALLSTVYEEVSRYELAFVCFEQVDRYDKLPLFFGNLYNVINEFDQVYSFLYVEDISLVETNYTKNYLCCRCNNPSTSMREQYLKRNLEWTSENARKYDTYLVSGASFSTEDIVRETAGYSYWELEQLVSCLKREAARLYLDPERAKEDQGRLRITLDREVFQMYLDAFKPVSPAQSSTAGAVVMNYMPANNLGGAGNWNNAGNYGSAGSTSYANKSPQEMTAREKWDLVVNTEI